MSLYYSRDLKGYGVYQTARSSDLGCRVVSSRFGWTRVTTEIVQERRLKYKAITVYIQNLKEAGRVTFRVG